MLRISASLDLKTVLYEAVDDSGRDGAGWGDMDAPIV